MKLLIVDDEIQIREGMKEGICWEEYGISQVDAAKDGTEAWEKFQKEAYDIALVDIRMPGMDGIALSRLMKEQKPDLKIMILSGFSEFEYARTAMQLGITHYELKPVNARKVMEFVQEAVQEIHEEEEKKITEQRHAETYKQKLLKDILIHKLPVSPELEKEFYQYNGFCLDGMLTCVLIETAANQEVFLISLLQKLFKGADFSIYEEREVRNYLLFAHNPHKKSLTACLDELYEMGIRYKADFSISVSSRGTKWELPVLMEELDRIQDCRLYKTACHITYYEKADIYPDKVYCPFYPIKELKKMVKEKNYPGAEQLIQGEFKRIEQEACYKEKSVQNLCIDLASTLRNSVIESGQQETYVIQDYIKFLEDTSECRNLADYRDLMLEVFKSTIDDMYLLSNTEQNAQIMKVVNYIRQNYKEQISAEIMADMIGKTPNYFSLIFKKTTGQSFHKYLTEVRIEKAKEMIETGQYLVYEIAEKVGFPDYKYFAKVFKAVEGCSISEYRKKPKK